MSFVAYSSTRIALALALGLQCACSVPQATDAMPTSTEGARHLAQAVASKGSCGSFEDYTFDRARDTWVFTCQKPGLSFEIVAYGSEDARSAGIKALDTSRTTYVAKDFYAVAVAASEPGNAVDSALAAFKK
jgi:hypothetical protein